MQHNKFYTRSVVAFYFRPLSLSMKRTLLFLFLCSSFILDAQVPKPTVSQLTASKARALVQYLQQYHYAPRTWNDSTSALFYATVIKSLDEDKMLFNKEDIAQLDLFKYKLDDELTGKEWGFFDKLTSIIEARLKEEDTLIKHIVSTPFDLVRHDNLQWPYTFYVSKGNPYNERWKQFLKWRTLHYISAEYYEDGKIASLEQGKQPADFPMIELRCRDKVKALTLKNLQQWNEGVHTASEKVEEVFLHELSTFYDPHTEYMDEKRTIILRPRWRRWNIQPV
jgi:carboxyl-terminal processing protease